MSEMTATKALEIYAELERRGIKLWIDGGWGVDALLGKQTRPHTDLDITLEHTGLPKLTTFFEENAYQNVPRDDTSDWNYVMGDAHGNEIDVHVVVFDAEGKGVYGPAENGIFYPKEAFEGSGFIEGKRVRCLTPEYQVQSHTGYQPLRDKDREDVRRLCERFGLELPKEYKA